jgi:hypothetical protein
VTSGGGSRLGEVQLEPANVLDRCRVGRTLEKCGKTLAAVDVGWRNGVIVSVLMENSCLG